MASLPPSDFPSRTTEIIATLQAIIAEGKKEEIAAILSQVVESAQALSGATGSAIAIRNQNNGNGEEVLCVARSGNTAPRLGSRLDENSGISGECLVTGRVLHCDDTAADHRVDPEVCRLLGLRSIIVVPVRVRGRIAGVLEVFSTVPHAFTWEHIDSLKRLAEIVETAYVSKSGGEFAPVARQEPYANTTASRPSLQQTPLPIAPHTPLPAKDRRRYWITGGVAAMLLLIILIGLKAFHFPRNSDASKQVTQSQVLPSSSVSAELRPSAPAANMASQTTRKRHNTDDEDQRLQKASKLEVLSGAVTPAPSSSKSLKSALAVQNHPQASSRDFDSSPVPSLPLLAKDSATPEVLLVPSLALPKFAPAISQGVTRGVLDHKVKPIYPPNALVMRLEGDVVLEATITKTGEVRDLKLLRGSSILGRAAIDAVKQWHYQPYRLNGQPIELQTEITVQFHAQ